jgi:myo-inositol 2-dehydrogenase/D-chiro-inositol 1-dehydrogenase
MEPIRVAVVGCGKHSTAAVFPNLGRAGLKLVAACDLDAEKAERNASQFGAEASYTDYRRVLERDDLEAVIVCGPPEPMHYRIGLEVMKAGFHCYTEKPPSRSPEQSREAWQVSRQTDRLLMCAFKKRYTDSYVKLKHAVDENLLGEMLTFNVNYQKGERANFATDSMVHIIDLIRFIMGEVERLVAVPIGSGLRAGFLVTSWFRSGAMGLGELSSRRSWVVPTERIEVTGDRGFAAVDNVIDYKRWEGDQIVEWSVPNYSTRNPYVTGLEMELVHFAACLRGEAETRSDAYSSYKTMQLIQAVIDSEGAVVEVARD